MEEDEVGCSTTTTSLPEWVALEYLHMRTLAGPVAHIHFTSLSASSSSALADVFTSHLPSPPASAETDPEPGSQLQLQLHDKTSAAAQGLRTPNKSIEIEDASASAHREGVLELMKQRSVPLERVCLLDPKAEKELSPEDGEGAFEWFLFGGILGASPRLTADSSVENLTLTLILFGDDPPRDRTGELRKLGFPTRHLGPVQMTTDTALGVTKKVVDDKAKLGEIPYVDFPTIRFNAKESVEMPFRYISVDGEPILPPGMRDLLHRDLDKGFEF